MIRNEHWHTFSLLWLTPLVSTTLQFLQACITHTFAAIVIPRTYASIFIFFIFWIWFGVKAMNGISFQWGHVSRLFNSLKVFPKYHQNDISAWMAAPERIHFDCFVGPEEHAATDGERNDERISFVDGDLWLTLWQERLPNRIDSCKALVRLKCAFDEW